MRRVLIVLGVLGSGTALTFGAAAAIFLAHPDGNMVANRGQVTGNVPFAGGGKVIPMPGIAEPIPMPMPVPDVPADGFPVPDAATGITLGMDPGDEVEIIDQDLPPQSGTEP